MWKREALEVVRVEGAGRSSMLLSMATNFLIITMIDYFAIYDFDRKEVNYAAHAFERDIGTVKTDSFM